MLLTSRRRLIAAAIIAIICQICLFSVSAVEADEGFFAACAIRQIVGHIMPLVDCVDTKPPGIFLLYEGAFRLLGAYNPVGLRLLWIAFAVGLAAAVRALRDEPEAGDDAAALTLLLLTTSNFFLALKTELPAVTLATAGVALAARRDNAALLSAGVLIGGATLFKQPAAILLIVAAVAARPAPWLEWRDWLRAGLLLALGWVLPLAATCAVYFNAGHLDSLIEQIWVRPLLYALHKSQGYSAGEAVLQMVRFLLAPLCAVGLFGVSAWQRSASPASVNILAFTYLSVATAFVSIGGHFFPSYALIMIPPIALLLTTSALPRSMGQPGGILALGGCMVACVVAATTVVTLRDAKTTDLDLARQLNAAAPQSEPLYVWGYVPELYPATGRLPVSKYIASSLLFGYFHDSSVRVPIHAGMRFVLPSDWDKFLTELDQHSFLLLDTSAIRMGSPRNFAPQNFSRMRHLMATRCQFVSLVSEFPLYRCAADRAEHSS